jgi:hypothetical protein
MRFLKLFFTLIFPLLLVAYLMIPYNEFIGNIIKNSMSFFSIEKELMFFVVTIYLTGILVYWLLFSFFTVLYFMCRYDFRMPPEQFDDEIDAIPLLDKEDMLILQILDKENNIWSSRKEIIKASEKNLKNSFFGIGRHLMYLNSYNAISKSSGSFVNRKEKEVFRITDTGQRLISKFSSC